MRKRGRPRHPDILTPREWEVLGLLREGLTNEQIAERLGVSFATARYHVSEILSKLGVSSREEAAAWRPEAERRVWWRLAWPLTAAKAAGVALAAALLAGLGVLAWTVLAGGQGVSSSEAEIAFLNDGDIWLSRADGSGARPLKVSYQDGESLAGGPVWSLDGQRIAVFAGTSAIGFWGGVYAIDLMGRASRIGDVVIDDVIFPCESGRSLEWSPDDQSLVYMSRRITVTDLVGRQSVIDGAVSSATWSPDGRSVVFAVESDNGCTIVTAPAHNLADRTPIASGTYPVWSPDGESIAFLRTELAPDADLFVLDLNDVNERQLTYGASIPPFSRVEWSPDSSRIAVTSFGDWPVRLWVIHVASGDVIDLGPGHNASWSPDGTRLIYENAQVIYLVDLEARGEPVKIADGENPSWRPVTSE